MDKKFVSQIKAELGLLEDQYLDQLIGRKFSLNITKKDLLLKEYEIVLYGTITAACLGSNETMGIMDDLFGVKLLLQTSNTFTIRSTSYLNHIHTSQVNRNIIIRCGDNGLDISYTTGQQLHDTNSDIIIEEKIIKDSLRIYNF